MSAIKNHYHEIIEAVAWEIADHTTEGHTDDNHTNIERALWAMAEHTGSDDALIATAYLALHEDHPVLVRHTAMCEAMQQTAQDLPHVCKPPFCDGPGKCCTGCGWYGVLIGWRERKEKTQSERKAIKDNWRTAHVKQNRTGNQEGTGRAGTIHCTLEHFAYTICEPHQQVSRDQWRNYDLELLDGAGKISCLWVFSTPRGNVTVHDYWWNKEDELSIGAENRKAALWLVTYLKARGISADTGRRA